MQQFAQTLQNPTTAQWPWQIGLAGRKRVLSLVQTAEDLPIAHAVHARNTAYAKPWLPV